MGASQTEATANEATKSFIRQAARGNDMEVALAEIGVRKAQNPDLKTFCQDVQKEHLQANNQLKPLAQQYGVPVDQTLTPTDRQALQKFEQMSRGPQFDQQLATELLRQHEKAIQQYEQALQQGMPTDVNQYASSTLPTLQQHLQHGVTVASTVGVDQATIAAVTVAAVTGGTAQVPEPNYGGTWKTEKGAGARQLMQGMQGGAQP